tara:strand:- start:199 stop:1107 length:909 start_codon:yes stop_codon:yes gene_type:complete
MEKITKKHNELIKKYPHLKEVLAPSYNSLIEQHQLQSKVFESVFNTIAKKIELIKEGFFISFQCSLNQELFLKIELKDLKKILKKGDSSKEIALNGFSDLLRINTNKTPEIYGKIIKGQVIQLIENAIESGDFDDLADIENTVALIEYEKFIEKIYLSNFNNNKKDEITPQQATVFVLKPAITKEVAETVFELLKDFFETEQQQEFKKVLSSLSNAKTKLVFKSNGNQLSDTFKKLLENHFITGFKKTDLIEWIFINFQFVYRDEIKNFKKKTLEQTVSGKQTPCKNPIIEIKNNQIVKIDK